MPNGVKSPEPKPREPRFYDISPEDTPAMLVWLDKEPTEADKQKIRQAFAKNTKA